MEHPGQSQPFGQPQRFGQQPSQAGPTQSFGQPGQSQSFGQPSQSQRFGQQSPQAGPAQPIEIKVNRAAAFGLAGALVVGAILLAMWMNYIGEFFAVGNWFDSGRGGAKFYAAIHVIMVICVVVAVLEVVRALSTEPQLVFDSRGVRLRNKKAAEGYDFFAWEQIGRVFVERPVAPNTKQAAKGKGTFVDPYGIRRSSKGTKKWFLVGRNNAELGSLAVTRLTPGPDAALPLIGALAAGRTFIG